MNCRHAEELIQQSLDGALTPDERARLDAHLTACPACRQAWNEHHQLARLAHRWTMGAGQTNDTGDAFTAQVLARVAARPVSAPSRPAFWRPLAAAALLLTTLAFLPHSLAPNWPDVGAASRELPGWLLANSRALPSEILAAWTAARSSLLLPEWIWSALLGVGAVNGLFYARAAQSRERSLR